MKNIYDKSISFLIIVIVSCMMTKGYGQSSYQNETKFALNKYYSNLNIYIVNQSNRDDIKELKTIFESDSTSIVQNDLNLLIGKSISTQTNLNEYLVALAYHANKSINDPPVISINWSLLCLTISASEVPCST